MTAAKTETLSGHKTKKSFKYITSDQ